MGLALYTVGIVGITIGVFRLVTMLPCSEYMMMNIMISIGCVLSGLVGALAGWWQMKEKGGH